MQNKTFYPTCRFCKQQKLPMAEYENQEVANEAATISCSCKDAREYQEKLKQQKERDNNIIKLRQKIDDIAEYCEKRNVEFSTELHDLILITGISVLDGVIASANVKFGRMKANLSRNSKGNIVIGFTYSDGAKVEI